MLDQNKLTVVIKEQEYTFNLGQRGLTIKQLIERINSGKARFSFAHDIKLERCRQNCSLDEEGRIKVTLVGDE